MKKLATLGLAIVLTAATVAAQTPSRTHTRPTVPAATALNRVNLKLAWRAYLPVDGQRDGIFSVQFLGEQMLVQLRSGAVILLNAETGQTLWQVRAGAPYRVMYPLGVNYNTVFGYSSTFLFGLDRATGELKYVFDLPAMPSAGP